MISEKSVLYTILALYEMNLSILATDYNYNL